MSSGEVPLELEVEVVDDVSVDEVSVDVVSVDEDVVSVVALVAAVEDVELLLLPQPAAISPRPKTATSRNSRVCLRMALPR